FLILHFSFPIPYYSLLLLPHLLDHEGALLVAGDDAEQAVAVDVGDRELRADAGVVVDDVRRERDDAVALLRLEPVDERRRVRIGVALRAMCPPALAGDEILQTVAVDVDAVHGVRLRHELREEILLDKRRIGT